MVASCGPRRPTLLLRVRPVDNRFREVESLTGKTVRILLADGEPTGILLVEISNWTGKVLVAPRSQLDQLSKREEVRRTGVCLLVGPDPDDPSRALAYIGEGDNVLERPVVHDCAAHRHPTLALTP